MEKYVIEKITLLKKTVKISLDNYETIRFNKSVCASAKLYKGKSFTFDELVELDKLSKEEDLFEFLLRKSKTTFITPAKAYSLLYKKGGKKPIVDNVIKRATKMKLLDEEFLFNEIIDKANKKHFGYFKIIQMLRHYKINEEIINKYKIDSERECKECNLAIKELIKKYSNKNNYQRNTSLINNLIRNGFESSLAIELVNKIPNSNKNHELNVLQLDYCKLLKKLKSNVSINDLPNKIHCSLLEKGYLEEDIKVVEEKFKNEMD